MICVVDCGSDKTENIVKILNGFQVENKVVAMKNLENVDPDQCSKIIISGAPILLTEVDIEKYLNKFNFIKSFKDPVLGICFGHQIIGLLFNAEVKRIEEVRDLESIEIIKKADLFSEMRNEESFQQDHCESITLPDSFELLARSGSCENEAMKHKDKDIYGVQFHPEVSWEVGRKLLINFVSIN